MAPDSPAGRGERRWIRRFSSVVRASHWVNVLCIFVFFAHEMNGVPHSLRRPGLRLVPGHPGGTERSPQSPRATASDTLTRTRLPFICPDGPERAPIPRRTTCLRRSLC
jgi:hypothetical protein